MSSGADLPRGTVTFLFTDIEGSTRLLRELRDRYGDALGAHRRVLRTAFARHGGQEIDTQGDSFFVAFPRARDAIAAAVEGQLELGREVWPDGSELRVRMGLHTGEPTIDGEGYVGLGIHRAARISGAGHGGQVLVSATTRELMRDDPLPDVSFVDLGDHDLKDFDAPERIYQVRAPGLLEAFPPLKSGSAAGGAAEQVAEREASSAERGRDRTRRTRIAAACSVAALVTVIVTVVLTRGGAASHTLSAVAANAVGVIDTTRNVIDAQIPVGSGPSSVSASGEAIWVTNSSDNTVSRIDPAANQLRQTIPVGGDPTGVVAAGDGVWVANGNDGTVSWINTRADEVVETVRVGNGPAGVAYGAGSVWVANSVDGTISRIDPTTGAGSRPIPAVIGASALAVGFGRVWVASASAGVVVAIDPSSGAILGRIGVGVDPSAITTGDGAVWVSNAADGTVDKIDPAALAVTDTISVGSAPDAIAAGANAIWVANAGSGTVSRIDAADDAVVTTIALRNPPEGLSLTPYGLYVTVRSTGLAHQGGTLRVLGGLGLDSIDPAVAYDADSWSILSITNDGLVAFRRTGGIEGVQLVPDLAESLPAPTDGGTTYSFRLRSGVSFSNGEPVSPQDFRVAIERLFELNPQSGAAHYYADIIGASRCVAGKPCDLNQGIVADPVAETVTFHLARPDGDFLNKLALTFADAVPTGTPTHALSFGDPVAATGPYMIASATKKGVRLERNPRFRRWSQAAQPNGYPNEIAFTESTQQADARAVAVEHDKADVAFVLSPPPSKAQLETLATRYPTQLYATTAPVMSFFFLNTHVAPFNNLHVRLAVNDAFDRQALTEQLGPAFAPTCQIIPPDFPSYRPTCPYGSGGVNGVTLAQALVHRSGDAGMRVDVWVLPPLTTQGDYMVSVLRAIGLRPRLRIAPSPNTYFPVINDSRRRTQAGIEEWASDFPSPSGFIAPLFLCAAFVPDSPQSSDPSEFCNRIVDEQITSASATQAENPPAANALWQRVELSILAKAPIVPMYNLRNIDFVSARVGNYEYNPEWGALLDQLWVR